MYLLRLSWRNIFRNKRRTALCSIAIAIGIACMIIAEGFMEGMFGAMISNATSTWTGHAQIHHKNYIDTGDIDFTVKNPAEVAANLRADKSVVAVSERISAFSMAASAANSLPVQLYGIDPANEAAVTQLEKALPSGTLSGALSGDQILIGKNLAEDLEVGPGDRIVITSSTAGGQGLAQQLFRVGAVYAFNIRQMDSGMAFIHIERARALLNLPGGAHEIVIRFAKTPLGRPEHDVLSAGGGDNLLRYWNEIMPAMDAMLKMSGVSRGISVSILFLVIGLGIVNTLFMAIYERMFEFGILKAVGTRPRAVFSMIFAEAGWIALIAAPLGALLGLALHGWFAATGVDFTGTEFSGVTFTHPIYPVLKPWLFLICPAGGVILTLLASVWPAVHAAKIIPAHAMRRSL